MPQAIHVVAHCCRPTARGVVILLIFLMLAPFASSYSVLTHEEIVDMAWNDQIQPLLLKKYPGTTPEQLKEAHAYAYGGCVIQDMGYYPFGNKEFSDLVHYVRSGDFVQELLRQATDVNEYAFALGALAHYSSDINGHPAVNRSVALQFPKLARKFGDEVTYEDDPKAHIRTEFGFDVTQVANGRYTSDTYHDFIGFKVARPAMERAFQNVYGVEFKSLFKSEDLAIGTYRRSISKVIPEMTRVALLVRGKQMVKEIPNFSRKKFLYHLSRADYEREWGAEYRRPGTGARILAFIFKLVPKVGPFKAIAFQTPTPQTENLYIKSIDHTIDNYRALLLQAAAGTVNLPNKDCDTGRPTQLGEYDLADHTYTKLLDKLADHKFQGLTPELQTNILQFFSAPKAAEILGKDPKRWEKTQQELVALRNTPLQPAPATVPSASK
jgi:zinc dependent phospholipase C